MTSRFLRYGAVLFALLSPIGAYAQSAGAYFNDLRPCAPGTHAVSFPNGQGYRCIDDHGWGG